ncbi:hypothetical protein TNCV_5010331 [Trichonephila clavipes]|nr:hypothetical protein TNCV_5010331 [Trichonephila clavipes]
MLRAYESEGTEFYPPQLQSSCLEVIASSEWALYQNSFGALFRNESLVSVTVVTHVGDLVASGPLIIDMADTAVATPLLEMFITATTGLKKLFFLD